MIEKLNIPHDKDFPSDRELCPCDDCVEYVEAKHSAAINEVWQYRLPYVLRSRSGLEASTGSYPPCTVCVKNIKDSMGGFAEISFHVYAPLVPSDTIPFHHVKRVLVHNSCAIGMLDEHLLGIGYTFANKNSRYTKHLEKLMRVEPGFIRRLARLVDYGDID